MAEYRGNGFVNLCVLVFSRGRKGQTDLESKRKQRSRHGLAFIVKALRSEPPLAFIVKALPSEPPLAFTVKALRSEPLCPPLVPLSVPV